MANVSHHAETQKRGKSRRRASVLVLHGPTLEGDGSSPCGPETIAAIDARLTAEAGRRAVELIAFQCDCEEMLVDRVRAAGAEGVGFIVINPGRLAHAGAPLRAALSSATVPFIEVRWSNHQAREPSRHEAGSAGKTMGTIVGLGAQGYELALTYAVRHVKSD